MPRKRCTTPLWNKPLPNGDVFYAFKIGQEYYAFIHRVSRFGLRWTRCIDHSLEGNLVSKRLSQAHATASDVIWVDDECCFQPVVPSGHLQVACTASKQPTALDKGFESCEQAQTDTWGRYWV